TFTTVSAPIQYAAIRAFEGGPDITDYLSRSRRILKGLGQTLTSRLRHMGCQLADPEGGFYLFPDFSLHREHFAACGIKTSRDLCKQLLDDAGVACLPGTDFGRPATEFTVRMAYVDFDGERALTAADPETEIDEAFLNEYCPNLINAMERIEMWLKRS
ncbi:MAG: aminotransferase class I/II-fold pyridoxal phosphate-dependent enzyme, partial [Candidatus Thiodiazotropha taylori]|nr:aminotransferase class I/II-fold pyridoxal phosphate-dependent enzyme [Candidatus Thiodiazotropha taylori]